MNTLEAASIPSDDPKAEDPSEKSTNLSTPPAKLATRSESVPEGSPSENANQEITDDAVAREAVADTRGIGWTKQNLRVKPPRTDSDNVSEDRDNDSYRAREPEQGSPVVPLRDQRHKAPEQIKEFGQFLNILEARLSYLEATLAVDPTRTGAEKNTDCPVQWSAAVDSPASEATSHSELALERSGSLVCEIKHGDGEFFYGQSLSSNSTRYVIEVQHEERKTHKCQTHEDQHKEIPDVTESETHANATALTDSEQWYPLSRPLNQFPQRVRILSRSLLKLLQKITGIQPLDPMTFLPPFKLFVRFEKDIREKLEDMENAEKDVESIGEANTTDNSKSTGQSVASPKDPEDDQDTNRTRAISGPDEERKAYTREEHKQLRLLVNLFDGALKPVFELNRLLREGATQRIAFDHLWYLFKLGQDVVCPDGTQVYRVFAFTGGREILSTRVPEDSDVPKDLPDVGSINAFSVHCYRYDFDGITYGPIEERFTISPYVGLKEITSLPVYPLIFHKDSDTFKNTTVKRGEVFFNLTKKDQIIHRDYRGLSLESPEAPAEEIESQIIVDHHLAMLKKPGCKPPAFGLRGRLWHDYRETLWNTPYSGGYYNQDYHVDRLDEIDYSFDKKHILRPTGDLYGPPEETLILLPSFVYGFVLRSRKWAKLKIEAISGIEYKNSFENLVLPKGHADAIKALVENHSRGPVTSKQANHLDVSMDLIRGKGKGLVILLHGEPGVGKTSTAECIADYTRRPLYPITCGDIGETANEVEESLEKTFQLAHKWGCVLLLDEADVFLQERTRDDLRRNAVVSVFLRVLEYYSGILFLTTNRVGTMDQAFRSRIHLSLYYPALSKRTTIKIWEMHLETAKQRFKESGREIDIEDQRILKFAREHFKKMEKSKMGSWNGRQIRNAFQTAIALAEYKVQHNEGANRGVIRLTEIEFERVAKTSDSFDKYLRATQRGTQASLAKAAKNRYDEYGRDDINPRGKKARRSTRRRNKHDTETESESSESSDSSSDVASSNSEESSRSEEESLSDQDEAKERQREKAKRKDKSTHKDKGKQKQREKEKEDKKNDTAEDTDASTKRVEGKSEKKRGKKR